MGAATLGADSSGSGGQQWRGEAAVEERGSVDRGRQRWWREAAMNGGSTAVVGAATLGGASNGGIQRASKQSRQRP